MVGEPPWTGRAISGGYARRLTVIADAYVDLVERLGATDAGDRHRVAVGR